MKSMKRTVVLLISAVLLVSMLVLGVVSKMQAQQNQQGQQQPCTLATLQGTYGILATGFFQFGATNTGAGRPFAEIGTIAFNGTGNAVGQFTFSDNGNISSMSAMATYTVAPDCTGTVTVLPLGSGAGSFVIVDHGSQFLFLQTVAGTVVSAIGIKQ